MSEVSITATASILPGNVISNEEIGERLIGDANLGETGEGLIHETRARSELIEKKTGLRERRFFDDDANPAEIGLDLLERLMADAGWSEVDAVIVSSSSTRGFPGLSQQIVAAAKSRHAELGNPFVLDISSNACTGFMYGVTIGAGLIKGMGYRRIALLAIEFASRCIAYLTIEKKGNHPRRPTPAHGPPGLRLRHLPGRLPLEPPRSEHKRTRIPTARVCASP